MNSFLPSSKKIILVTGAARSGKSEWAEQLAKESNKQVIYIATAQIAENDPEWQEKIVLHQKRRPKTWETWEVGDDLTTVITKANSNHCLLVDSLGTWVAKLLEENDVVWQQIATEFLQSLIQSKVDIILVGEETGWGVIPAYASGRKFRDRLGNLVRQIGGIATVVYLVTGGHVLNLSQLGQPLPNQKLTD